MERHEEAGVGVGHVDLDAAQEDQIPRAVVRVDDGQHLVLHGLVGLHDEVHHDVLRVGDIGHVGLQMCTKPALLHILGVSRDVRAGGELAVGSDDRPAGGRDLCLAGAQELAWLATWGEADVRTEHDEDVAIVRHMVRECHEAGLADVGGTADAAEGEGPSVVLCQPSAEMAPVAVDLVGADGLAVDG
eukprot:CAMPEP_0197871978 /NCGR_PEP_ID=MMETSP1439-20131203/2236_1 /TAXON_ID=66791 /ORGANISM="Gonyaulax spinifera, Strain CCMP409" /LENGTH=187 /DNA_ID=CAMNT_0043490945 /DNA_START=177 /DNA_END=737 /DNA_ORIENTATION=+